MSQINNHRMREAGFTLVELAIVLVIIGLIVGGVLAGQQLIQATEQRATLAQMQEYNAAANTFRAKYKGIPGDIRASDADKYGIAVTAAGGRGLGDGNRALEDPLGTNTPVGEILLFWRHLSDAGLIKGTFGQDLTMSTAQAPNAIIMENAFPAAKLGNYSFFIVGSDNGVNYFGLLGMENGATGGAAGTANYFPIRSPSVSGLGAFQMDEKIDDGRPLTGRVQARGYGAGDILTAVNGITNFPYWTATPTDLACVIGATWPIPPSDFSQVKYNLDTDNGGDVANCSMRFRFQ